jgi:large subunit ribosomal protein L14
MIYTGTILNVSDNSGAKRVKCLKVLGHKARSYGKVGDTIVVSIKRTKKFSKIKKKEIYKAIIVCIKKKMFRYDGSLVSFSKNAVILLSPKGLPLGSRVLGPVSKELRVKKNLKLVSLCTKMI